MWDSQLECLSLLARYSGLLAGDVIELGVYRGGSAVTIFEQIPEGKRLYLCDTFSGMPDEVLTGAEERSRWRGAHAKTSVKRVRALFAQRFGRVRLWSDLPVLPRSHWRRAASLIDRQGNLILGRRM